MTKACTDKALQTMLSMITYQSDKILKENEWFKKFYLTYVNICTCYGAEKRKSLLQFSSRSALQTLRRRNLKHQKQHLCMTFFEIRGAREGLY